MNKIIGTWWSDRTIELAEIDGKVFALNGWNGEAYLRCWKCFGEYYTDASEEDYAIIPVYSYGEDEENPDIIDYEVEAV